MIIILAYIAGTLALFCSMILILISYWFMIEEEKPFPSILAMVPGLFLLVAFFNIFPF